MQKRTTISYEHRLLYICITCTVFHKVSAFFDMIASLINHQFLELRWIFIYSTGSSNALMEQQLCICHYPYRFCDFWV